jgi:hypothetical protein
MKIRHLVVSYLNIFLSTPYSYAKINSIDYPLNPTSFKPFVESSFKKTKQIPAAIKLNRTKEENRSRPYV